MRWPALQIARAAADLTAIIVAFMISYRLYTWAIEQALLYRSAPPPEPYAVIGVAFGILALLSFWGLGLYRDHASVLNLWEYETALKGLALAAACFLAALFFLRLEDYSRLVVVGAIGLATCLVLLERRVLSAAIRRLQLAGKLGRRALIYGTGDTGRLVLKKIIQSPQVGRTVVGFLDDAAGENAVVECRVAQGGPIHRVPVLGRLDDLRAVAATHDVTELFVTAGTGSSVRMREIFEVASDCELGVAVVPKLGDVRVDQVRVEDLSAVPLLRLRGVSSRRLQRIFKRGFDLAGALACAIATLPFWAAAWWLLRRDRAGPVLFAHERVGLDGRRFRLLKFRTMRPDANPYAPSPQSHRDPRITPIGRILRFTGVDELPQIINVLRGEMSLVGPRPEMPFIVDRYGPLERERLRVKPGITGLWQVSADRQAEIHENIEYDLYYVCNQSLLLDALVILETGFFTAGLVLRALVNWPARRRMGEFVATAVTPEGPGSPGDGPVAHTAPESPDHPGDYALVALDQRRSDDVVPVTWTHGIPAAAALARRWPVKVLAAGSNRAVLDRLLAQADRGEEWEDRHTMYVSYRARAELRELTLGAGLVLTDLAHVAEWATRAGVPLIWVTPHGLGSVQWNGNGSETAGALAQWVEAPAASEAAVR